jgi:hypothetical protein
MWTLVRGRRGLEPAAHAGRLKRCLGRRLRRSSPRAVEFGQGAPAIGWRAKKKAKKAQGYLVYQGAVADLELRS